MILSLTEGKHKACTRLITGRTTTTTTTGVKDSEGKGVKETYSIFLRTTSDVELLDQTFKYLDMKRPQVWIEVHIVESILTPVVADYLYARDFYKYTERVSLPDDGRKGYIYITFREIGSLFARLDHACKKVPSTLCRHVAIDST
jgi:hypothetical protein